MYKVPVFFGFYENDSRFMTDDQHTSHECWNDEHYTVEQCQVLFDFCSAEMKEVDWIKSDEEFQEELKKLTENIYSV